MKKTYTEAQLKEKANEVFAQFPKANKVFATVDGNVFLQENYANMHAGAKGRVLPFDRPIEAVKEAVKAPTADEQIKAITAVTTLEALEPFKADTRKSVMKAIEDKTAELTKSQA
ncbi:hypothetical protein GCM10008015_26800 [Flavobacterium palustre]|uniref:PRTRC system protein E n=1 Tax=Flavobacterium palustre TaxID=1476463 RepID=A0ABQ1HQ06_9FLAO|nr:hypothetical protein [Flavobacterium palustre]GGA84658.1 hypothetical protein GCM10008015_26800 [Flavobacterium palustre]